LTRVSAASIRRAAEVGNMFVELAGSSISNEEFKKERELPNGWKLDTNEELLYFCIFRMH